MIGDVFSSTMVILKERWLPILLSTLASLVVTLVLMFVLLIPAIKGMVPGFEQGAASSSSLAATQQLQYDPATGAPTAESMAALQAQAQTQAQGVSIEGPGMGDIAMLLVAVVAVMVAYLGMMTTGIFAAAGSSAGSSIKLGFVTSPHVVVQSFLLGWQPMAAYLGAILLSFVVHPILGFIAMLGALFLWLRISGTVSLAMGAIAHGHVSFSPDAARSASEGRRWLATGVAIVGGMAGAALSVVPLLGPVFISAYLAAMWREFDGGSGPSSFGGTPDPSGDATWQQAQGSAQPANQSAVVAQQAGHQPAVAVAVATGHVVAEVATQAVPAAAPLEAGPSWSGMATHAEPLGQWIQLAQPVQVALQAQWTTGQPPAVQLADQAGAWTTPASQPTASGETAWLQLPAGWTWVALVPRDPQQQLWITTWVPAGSNASAA